MQFGSAQINANIPIFVILGSFFVLVFVFGEAKLKRIALAMLAGLFVADQLSGFVGTQLEHIGVKSVDEMTLKLILLAATMLPMSLGKSPSVGGHFSIRSFILALLSAATLIAYTQSYMSYETIAKLTTDYNLVAITVNNKAWWLTALIIWMIILHIWKRKPKDADDDKKGKKKRR